MLKISQLKQSEQDFINFLLDGYTDSLCTALMDFFGESSADDLDNCFSSQKNIDWFKDNIMRPIKANLRVEDPQDLGDNFVNNLFHFYVKR